MKGGKDNIKRIAAITDYVRDRNRNECFCMSHIVAATGLDARAIRSILVRLHLVERVDHNTWKRV